MNSRGAARAILLGVVCTSLCSISLGAQSPTNPPNCPLSPSGHQDERERPRVFIDSVEFDGLIHLSDSSRQELVSELHRATFFSDADLPGELEYAATSAWQDQGFFTVVAKSRQRFVGGDEEQRHYSVTIHVDEGLQYWMGDLNIVNSDPHKALPFPLETLRQQIPLQRGDFFSVEKVRKGLEALKRLYNSIGYLDFTAVPMTEVDQEHQVINLTLELDLQMQYRVRTVEVIGPDPTMENILKAALKSGEVLDSVKLDDLFRKSNARLPPGGWEQRMDVRRDVKTATVDLRLDLRPCPATED